MRSSSPSYLSIVHEEDEAENAASEEGEPAAVVNEHSLLGTDPEAKEEGRMPVLRQAQLFLYVSHAFSQFAEGAWQFAVVLFLAAIAKYQSILLVSTYSLATYAAVMALGAPFGRFVDRVDRLVAARVCIGVQNGSVLLATLCACWLLTRIEKSDPDRHGIPKDTSSILLVVGIHIFGSVAQVLDQAFVVAIERDWIVVLSQQVHVDDDCAAANQDSAAAELWLSGTNVVLRQIDLTCKVLAPAAAGWIVGNAGTAMDDHGMLCHLHGASILVGVMNVTALLVEYVCTARMYHLIPALSVQQEQPRLERKLPDCEEIEEFVDEHQEGDKTSISALSVTGSSLWHGLRVYMKQSIALGGLSLALLYLNCLSFGGIMTAYLLWKGMPVEQVGLWRSIASVTGLLGTFAYQLSTKYTTVVKTGELSAMYLLGCLTLAVSSSFFIDDYNISTYLFVVTCALSRIGLWVFDITITLLYQEFVPDGVRGLVGGTQQAINSFFVVLTSGLGLFFRRPEDFFVFAAASYFGIFMSTVMYTFGIYRRSHLFHMAPTRESA